MNYVVELKKGGRFRRELEKIFRQRGWWVHSIHPKSFERSVNGIPLAVPDDLDVQYEFVMVEFEHMEVNLKEDRSGFVLILVDVGEDSLEKLKEDVGALSFREFGDSSPEEVFKALVPHWKSEENK